MKRGPRIFRKIILNRRPLLVLLGIFVIADLIAAAMLPGNISTYYFSPDDHFLAEDPELFWMPQKRFRDRFRTAEKAPGRLAYTFGGSIVTSIHTDTDFSAEAAACADSGVTWVNFGFNGYTTHQSLRMMSRAFARRTPDLAVVCNGFNDFGSSVASDTEMEQRNRLLSTRMLYWVSRIHLVRAQRLLIRKIRGFDPYKEMEKKAIIRVPVQEYHDNLKQMIDLASGNGVPLIFVTQSYPSKEVNEAARIYFAQMQELAASHPNVYLLDVRPEMEQAITLHNQQYTDGYRPDERPYLFADYCHLSRQGHELVGQLLCDKVQKIKVFSD